jgi:hypothetical protein
MERHAGGMATVAGKAHSLRVEIVLPPVPNTQTPTMTVVDYKGYKIEVTPVGKGWRASIFSPGSTAPWPNSPVNLEKSSTERIIVEAKRIIDVRLGPRLI